MKKFFLVSLIFAQSCIAFAQDSVRETQLPITENGTLIRFYYFNNEWIAMYKLVQTDSIKAIEIKNDEYYNRENETSTILKRNEQIFSFFASFFLLLFRPLKHHFNAD